MNQSAFPLYLGIYGYDAKRPHVGCRHNSGAVLISAKGEFVFAVEEERLSRVKNDARYPLMAIDEALEQGLEVANVAIAGWPRHRYMSQALANYGLWARQASSMKQKLHFWNRSFDFPIHAALAAAMGLPSAPSSLRALPSQSIRHHHAHAAGAYYCSPWADRPVLLITLDAAGDAESGSIWMGQNGTMERLASIPHPHSIGAVYSAFTSHLGFQPNRHEGKVLGLAAYGQGDALAEALLAHTHFSDEGYHQFDSTLLEISYGRFAGNTIQQLAGDLSQQDIAAGVQQFTETTVLEMVRYWVQKTGIHHLGLAGGVFANVKLNQRILALDSVENIYIYPNMGDGGLAAGAALAMIAEDNGGLIPRALDSVYLGSDIRSEDAEQAIQAAKLCGKRLSNVADAAAALLAAGKVVARAAGRMEYGPRALGNRTLFASCDDPTINQWLNEKLQRTEFMPFAPIIMEDYAAEYFPDWRADHVAARFMTITYDASELAKQKIPAAIHVDGTARPQVLRQQDNPEVYEILKAYHSLTGVPALINTSYNMHEEPIVRSADDAVRAFLAGHLDALLCADWLVVANG